MSIGWIGTGVMGRYMAEHLMNAGHSLKVFNRTMSKAQPLLDAGAETSTPAEIGASCKIIFTMLGYPHDVEEIILNQVLPAAQEGTLIVDHTTSSPSLAKRIAEAAAEKQVQSIDAPVSGGDVGAKNGKLAIMCGGAPEAFEQAKPFLDVYGLNIKLMGGPGMGQHTKLANQIVITGNMIGMVEGLIYGSKAGLDLNEMIPLLGSGAASSASLNVLGPRVLARNFDPGFFIEHFVKDMGMALQEAQRMNLCLPGLSMVAQLYNSLLAHDEGRLGTQALALVLERLNNYEIK